MGMAAPRSITTIEELLALPDDGLVHELLDGVHVVTPVPRPAHERPAIADGVLDWSLSVGVAGTIDLPQFFKRVE